MTTRAQSVPDEEIVRQIQETGHKECFAELFLRHRKRVFFGCREFLSEWQAAEDATQETFLRVYRSLHTFREGDFSTWIMRIARNVCVDEWRRRRLEKRPSEIELTEVADPRGLDSMSASRSLAEKVRQEMWSLSSHQRRCLELKIEGYSYEETAARTGLSVEAVKSHLQNGRRMLWRRVEGMLAQVK